MHKIFNLEKNHIYYIYLLDLTSFAIDSVLWFSDTELKKQNEFKQELREIENKFKKLKGGSFHTFTESILIDSKYLIFISKYQLEISIIESWKERKYFINSIESTGFDLWNIITMFLWHENIYNKNNG